KTNSGWLVAGDKNDCEQHPSLQWLEVIHHSRNKLRHGGMNVHRALHHRVGRLGVHNIENAVNDLVTFEAEEGGAQYLFAISIHQDFHEPLGLAFLICAADIFHSQYGNERGLASLADFLFRHPPTTKWGIGVERVSGDAVAHTPLIVVEKVGRHDLEIVPRGVREPTPAIAVAHRPDARDVGVQLVVHLDMAARVGDDAGLVEPKLARG